ncbi:ninjurin-2-like [Glandiceps talaboti]
MSKESLSKVGPSEAPEKPKPAITIIDTTEDEEPVDHTPQSAYDFDNNFYAAKNTIGQAFLTLTVLTSNAAYLRILVHRHLNPNIDNPDYYELLVVLLSFSLILSVVIGGLLFVKLLLNINKVIHLKIADRVNDTVLLFIIITTIFNIFIASFSGPMD